MGVYTLQCIDSSEFVATAIIVPRYIKEHRM